MPQRAFDWRRAESRTASHCKPGNTGSVNLSRRHLLLH